jgi:hypothetical protein
MDLAMTTPTHDSDQPGHEGAVAHHAIDDHGQNDHVHDDTDPLGPIDIYAWGAGALGVVLGLAVVWAFAIATAATATS